MFSVKIRAFSIYTCRFENQTISSTLSRKMRLSVIRLTEAFERAFAQKSNLEKSWWRFKWNWCFPEKKFGLLFNDCYFDLYPEVKEAIRRLPPHEWDARAFRLSRAHTMGIKNEILPKDQWTKWQDETWYLEPYLEEIEREKMERSATGGLKPLWHFKHEYRKYTHVH